MTYMPVGKSVCSESPDYWSDFACVPEHHAGVVL